MTMTRAETRQRLIDAGLVIVHAGLDDSTRGHISVRDPDDSSLFFMKPHSYGLDEITEENMVTCNLDGEKVAGGGRCHSEVFIHSEIFKARPDVNAILHAHPTHAIALSALNRPLRYFVTASAEFGDGVGIFESTRELIRSPETGSQLAEALGSHRAALMRNHGVAVVGKTIEECTFLAISLERACEMQLLVEQTGADSVEIPRHEIESLQEKVSQPIQYQINFDYLLRRAKRAR